MEGPLVAWLVRSFCACTWYDNNIMIINLRNCLEVLWWLMHGGVGSGPCPIMLTIVPSLQVSCTLYQEFIRRSTQLHVVPSPQSHAVV